MKLVVLDTLQKHLQVGLVQGALLRASGLKITTIRWSFSITIINILAGFTATRRLGKCEVFQRAGVTFFFGG